MLRLITAIVADATRVGKTFHNNHLLISEVPIVSFGPETRIGSSNLGAAEGCEYHGGIGSLCSHIVVPRVILELDEIIAKLKHWDCNHGRRQRHPAELETP